jgi:hypothetical protein
VEGGPGEVLQAGNRRDPGNRELAAGGDQHVGLVRSGGGLEHPAPARLVERRPLYLGAQADTVEHSVAPRHVLHVRLDLRASGVPPRPVRVRGERELVEVRRHVATDARIGVEVPDAADPIATFEDGHIVVALTAQHDRRADAAEAAADDRDGGLSPPRDGLARVREGVGGGHG